MMWGGILEANKDVITADHVNAYLAAARRHAPGTGVRGIDLGWKMVDGESTDDLAVRFHVVEKRPRRSLERHRRFPSKMGGVWTDVIQARYVPHTTGIYRFDPDRAIARSTVQPGISIGHGDGSYGTLGAIVADRTDPEILYLLSCDHVLAPGHTAKTRDPIVQPGPWDGGVPEEHTIARLWRRDPATDSAVARIETELEVAREQYGTGVTVRDSEWPRLGQVLEKSGRTTDVTRARVTGFGHWPPSNEYGVHLSVVQTSADDVEISHEGDSGSSWYDPDTHRAMVLLSLGEPVQIPFHEYAIGSCIEAIKVNLQIAFPA